MPVPVKKKPVLRPPDPKSIKGQLPPKPAPGAIFNPPNPNSIKGQLPGYQPPAAQAAAAPARAPRPRPTYGAAPATAQGMQYRSDADMAAAAARNQYRQSVYGTVMGLGDPRLMERFKNDPEFAGYQFNADPTSTYGQIQEAENRGLRNVNENAVRSNTFFSGLRLNDQDEVRQDMNTQRAGASRTIQQALEEYAAALAAAQQARQQAYTSADQYDFESALAAEPEFAEPEPAPLPPLRMPTIGPSKTANVTPVTKSGKGTPNVSRPNTASGEGRIEPAKKKPKKKK